MLRKFYPAEMADSSYEIDYEAMYAKGYRGLIYDIDNTLVEHGADANEQAIALLLRLNALGFRICLLSNNKEPRVLRFYEGVTARGVKLDYIYDAHKPMTKNYELAMARMETTVENTLFIGDQLFTDVFGANLAGIHSILVKPIAKREEIQIVLKRRLESIVLYFYRRRQLKQLRKENVVLIGFMGSGKSTVGKLLAEKLDNRFVDTDAVIEKKVGCSISELFETKGEEYFRDLESKVLKGLAKKSERFVIATGGGMPVRPANREAMRSLGTVVYLKANAETIAEHLQGDTTRPLLQTANKEETIRERLADREPIYAEVAHRVVTVDGRAADEIVRHIVEGVAL